jgi:beta-phosphoglucomutase
MTCQLAAIFDMDGVLVDSYHAHFKSWQLLAAVEGRTLSEAEFAEQFGRTNREIITTYWGDDRYSEEELAVLDDRKEAAYREILRADFPPMPGAESLLRSLHDAGFGVAVGSSGPPENIELVLGEMGIASLFGAVVTARDVTRGKPDPQVFLIAAERLGVAPARCAVVEDAPAGVIAANSAGMASIGLASTGRARAELSEADLIVDSLDELSPALVRDLIERAGRGRSI